MEDRNEVGMWYGIAALAVFVVMGLVYLLALTHARRVDVTVVDSLRQEKARLADTAHALKSVPPETVHVDTVGTVTVPEEQVREAVNRLEAVLPSAKLHPSYQGPVRRIRRALDSVASDPEEEDGERNGY